LKGENVCNMNLLNS